jgi:hypothetical protein
MQSVTNQSVIEKGTKIGRTASFVGLAILLIGLVVSFVQIKGMQQSAIFVVYGCLLVGFILSNIGIYMANRWVREPRADQNLDKVFKGLDKRYTLYNYYLPASHVLTTPTGLITFTVQHQTGTISCEGDKWRHRMTLGRLFRILTDEGLGNPTKEAYREASEMNRLLQDSLPEATFPITPLILFDAEPDSLDLTVTNASVPVLRLSELKEAVREAAKGHALPTPIRRQLQQALDQACGS